MGRKSLKIKLNVFLNDTLVGVLTKEPSGLNTFKYDAAYLKTPNAIPISRKLLLTDEAYKGDMVVNYFENLLPDNTEIRKAIAVKVKATSSDPFELLAAIGKDCIGAISFIKENESAGPSKKTPISNAEIGALLQGLSINHLGIQSDVDFRISLAGAQEKTALLRLNSKWYRPSGIQVTTHILKPAMKELYLGNAKVDMSLSVENEWLCLELIKAFGVPTADASMFTFDETRTLVVTRFDRKIKGQKVTRLLQEDFCQITGTPSHLKYESDGGPGIVDIMKILNESVNREEDRRNFMKTIVLFQLLAATDGHAKNFSLFTGATGSTRVTPVYDVLSVHPLIKSAKLQIKDVKMAMGVGDNHHRKVKQIVRRHYLQTAKACKYSETQMDMIIDEVINQAPSVVDKVRKRLPKGFPEEISSSIIDGILSNLSKLRA